MSHLVIPNVDEAVLERLCQRAAQHSRTMETEARMILQEVLLLPRPDPWAGINALREELARSGRDFPDSTPLIREDRDR